MSQSSESKLLTFYRSQTGRKIITGVTGIGLMGFVLVHLLGNLGFFVGSDAVNAYTAKLQALGPLLIVVELGLTAIVLFHAILGMSIAMEKRKARPVGYAMQKSGGAPSRLSASSKSMIYTGVLLLVFMVVHVAQFRFGKHVETNISGHMEPVRDMFIVVIELFQNPIWVAFYVGIVLLLGFHLRHGFWSAFQSVGLLKPRLSNTVYTIGLFFALLIALGFVILPIYLHLAY